MGCHFVSLFLNVSALMMLTNVDLQLIPKPSLCFLPFMPVSLWICSPPFFTLSFSSRGYTLGMHPLGHLASGFHLSLDNERHKEKIRGQVEGKVGRLQNILSISGHNTVETVPLLRCCQVVLI